MIKRLYKIIILLDKFMNNRINDFKFNGVSLEVEFIEQTMVKDGVSCDIYKFVKDDEMDLATVEIEPNNHTPRQLVMKGDKTIEGYIFGEGRLVRVTKNGLVEKFKLSHNSNFTIEVNVGGQMQWFSSSNSELVFYEICFPPFEDGRFKNLDQ